VSKKICPLGEDCDLTIARMKGAEDARNKAKARIEALEAKLAKAVEAAYSEGFLAGTEDGWVNNPRIDVEWKYSQARANLAELKGDKT
jgi:hypothetical protein